LRSLVWNVATIGIALVLLALVVWERCDDLRRARARGPPMYEPGRRRGATDGGSIIAHFHSNLTP
jgi:hypothetical protein